jgi:hypothetical protein
VFLETGMPTEELMALLVKARTVLDRYLFEEDGPVRDDVAETCMAIDDVLSNIRRLESAGGESQASPLPRSAAA